MAAPVHLSGFYEQQHCGYCKWSTSASSLQFSSFPPVSSSSKLSSSSPASESNRRVNYGLICHRMPVSVYDDMLNCNWRRSGSFYYRPSNFEICCPQIAIRISAAHFQPSRSHLRTLKRFRRFLSNDHCVDTDIEHYTLVEQSNNVQDNIPQTDNVKDDVRKSAELGIYSTDDQPSCPKDQRRPADINDSTGFSVIERYTSSLQQAVLKLSCNAFHGRVLVTRHRHRSDCLVSTIAQPLFGWLRSRKEQQHFSSFQSPRDVAERLQSLMNDDNVKVVGNGLLEIQLSQPLQESLNDQKGSLEDKHTKKNSSRPVAKKLRSDERDQQKRLVLHLQPSCFMKDEFELYSLYQSVVHGDTEDEITKDGYERFLCKSSLLPTYTPSKSNERIFQVAINGNTVEFQGNLLLPGYGSFHLRYEIIDSTGKTELMAVSILDILPTGLSSVYFTYNPSFSSLSPGTLSAFIELALMPRIQIPCISSSASLDVQAASDEFKYYYLGFYVHSCRKMRYKGQFNPSELLCPETLRWTLMDDRVRNVLDRERCARLALDGDVDGFNWCVRKITFQLQITIMFFSKLMKKSFRSSDGRRIHRHGRDADVDNLTSREIFIRLTFGIRRGNSALLAIPGSELVERFPQLFEDDEFVDVVVDFAALVGFKLTSSVTIVL